FTEPSKSASALNFTTFLAAILIVFPGCGFLPSLVALSETDHDQNPTNQTLSPFAKVSETSCFHDSKANFTAAFEIPAFSTITSIYSVLFFLFFFKVLLITNTNLKVLSYYTSFF